MATTTPNFGWPVPTSTDLVKDGATAIEALGDSIDASLLDLKGGTSGQVLSKNSNTDMDFTWVTSDDANAIQNTIVDAKGDLIGATAADTPARLAVGTNGQVLTADSTAATGLKWAAPSGGALILTGSADFTTSSAVNINNCFSSTYLNYFFMINLTAVSATDMDLGIRMRVGGADNSSANYNINEWKNNGATAGGYRSTTFTTFNLGNAASSKVQFLATQGHFYDPFIATPTKLIMHQSVNNSSDNYQTTSAHSHNVSTSYDGFSLIPGSGTISGKIRIYGYALS